MRFQSGISLLFAFVTLVEGQTLVDKCPKDEDACHDIINSSQCIAQVVLDNRPALNKANLLKCVEYEGTVSDLPGPEKYCRCTGCHSPPINEAIVKMFACSG